jgi:hypothetical protein
MLVMGRMDMASKALTYLAHETYSPIPEYKIERDSPYYFMERYYCPYTVEADGELEAGEGALNIVSVAEPLKIGRMLAGFDNSGDTPLLSPLLPNCLTGYDAEDVPLLCRGDLYYADISCRKVNDELSLSVTIKNGILPRLTVKGECDERILTNVKTASVLLK